MKAIINWIKNEPALVTGIVSALIGVLVAFNIWHPTDDQLSSLMILIGVITGGGIRQLVTPTNKLP